MSFWSARIAAVGFCTVGIALLKYDFGIGIGVWVLGAGLFWDKITPP